MEKQFFCGHGILTKSVFVTQLSSNAGISVWRSVWVATNFCLMIEVRLLSVRESVIFITTGV